VTEAKALNTRIRIRRPAKKEENLMPFPETLDKLRAAGYRFNLDAHCRGCGARIEWWITPAGKHMPMDVTDSGKVQSHFATCPKVEQFRKERA